MTSRNKLAGLCLITLICGCASPRPHTIEKKERASTTRPLPTDKQVQQEAAQLYEGAYKAVKSGKYDEALKLFTSLKDDYGSVEMESGDPYMLYAQHGLDEVTCLQKRGKPIMDTKRKIVERVLQALKNRDQKMLEKLAACSFNIGVLETDNNELSPSEKVIPRVLQMSQNTEWARTPENAGPETFMIRSVHKQDKDDRALFFYKDKKLWYWSGFAWDQAASQ